MYARVMSWQVQRPRHVLGRYAPRKRCTAVSFLRQVRRLREIRVGEVDVQIRLRLELRVLGEEILGVPPVVDGGPRDRLPLGLLAVDDRHGAVDLEEGDLLVEGRRLLDEDLRGLVAVVEGVLPAALGGAEVE